DARDARRARAGSTDCPGSAGSDGVRSVGERAAIATGAAVPQAGGIRARNGPSRAVDLAVWNTAARAADGAVRLPAAARPSDPGAPRAAAAGIGHAAAGAAPRAGHPDAQDAADDGERGAAAGAAARICRADAEGAADTRI